MNDLFGHGELNDGSLLQHLDDDLIEERRHWPRDLVEMSDFLRAQLNQEGESDERTLLLADKLLVALAFRSGGRGFYLPKADRVKRALRDKQLYEAFNGRNIYELVRRFDLSEVKVYQVIKEQRALHMGRIQPSLLD
ncbi:Mor transcription activator family protein [Kistimonas scapharcae]|uniref:Mor transcription activator family protein n=1 Tax=Kistimonas scapharcae TaxID=1036133 RepID=A0ABP8V3L9_9GAMM